MILTFADTADEIGTLNACAVELQGIGAELALAMLEQHRLELELAQIRAGIEAVEERLAALRRTA